MNVFLKKLEKKFKIQNIEFFLFLVELQKKFDIHHNWMIEFLKQDLFIENISYLTVDNVKYILHNGNFFAKLKENSKWGCNLDHTDEPILKNFIKSNPNYTILNGHKKLLV